MEPILDLHGVTRRYGSRTAVASASFALHEGRTACLLGPSGCGKSTLLRMIAGLEPLDEGAIRIAGREVSAPGRAVAPEDRGVGLVFQDNALFPHLNVRGNVGFGLRHLSRTEREAQVARLLEQMQVGHLADAWPHQLSGGEQQRVAVARALAREPALLLLDEPFSGLDGMLRESVREALLADLRRTGTTVLIVTHDPAEAMAIADDLILMAGGEVLQVGSPEQCYRHPVNATAARLLGEIVLITGEVRGEQLATALGTLPAGGWPDGPAQLGIRPEALHFASEGAAATVRDARFTGGGTRLTLDLGGLPFALHVAGPAPQAGETVHLGFDAAAARILA